MTTIFPDTINWLLWHTEQIEDILHPVGVLLDQWRKWRGMNVKVWNLPVLSQDAINFYTQQCSKRCEQKRGCNPFDTEGIIGDAIYTLYSTSLWVEALDTQRRDQLSILNNAARSAGKRGGALLKRRLDSTRLILNESETQVAGDAAIDISILNNPARGVMYEGGRWSNSVIKNTANKIVSLFTTTHMLSTGKM